MWPKITQPNQGLDSALYSPVSGLGVGGSGWGWGWREVTPLHHTVHARTRQGSWGRPLGSVTWGEGGIKEEFVDLLSLLCARIVCPCL